MTLLGSQNVAQYAIINTASGVGFGDGKITRDIVALERVSRLKDVFYIANIIPDDYDVFLEVNGSLDLCHQGDLEAPVVQNTRIFFIHQGLMLSGRSLEREVEKIIDIYENTYPTNTL